MVQKFKDLYTNDVIPYLKENFKYVNVQQIPRIEKIQINRGLGVAAQNTKILKKSVEEFRLITGQQPIITTAKKSIAGFKIRDGMPIGLKVTLRKEFMYNFLDKLNKLIFPRIRDFQGLNSKGFDGKGNFTFGLTDQLVFQKLNMMKLTN